ncbi:thioredoxin family protein [Mesonia mobilis]|nr:thioredoxin family protein [Mesonia mobilis]
MHLFPSTFISKIILFSGIIFYFGLFSSEENTTKKGIDFYNGNYEEALQKAKTEEKLVFVYLYADWCGVCKSLKKNTLKDKKVG